MKKILWFTLQPCGSARRFGDKFILGGWLISLEDELKKQDKIDLHVAFISDEEDKDFDFEGVHYHPMLLKRSSWKMMRVFNRFRSIASIDKQMLPVMLDVVKRVRPDLIHIHGTEERFALIQDYIHDIPICISIQGLIRVFGEKYFTGFPKHDAYKLDVWRDRIRHLSIKDDYASFVYRGRREEEYLSKAQYILGRTFWDRDITLAMNPKRKYFVADEVMRNPFYSKEWNKVAWSDGKLKLISTISGGIYKGFEVVLKTANILKRYSGLNFEWNIVGYDNKSKWVRIPQKITQLNHNNLNIKLLGRLDAKHLSQKLIESDIYVHVSHIENSPNSVCEAMLVGMPVIASFAGGTASLLKNGIEGELVQDGDPYVLAGAIVDMYQNFDRAKAYGQTARQTALVRHDPQRITNELIKTYIEIIDDFKNNIK